MRWTTADTLELPKCLIADKAAGGRDAILVAASQQQPYPSAWVFQQVEKSVYSIRQLPTFVAVDPCRCR